MFAALTAVSIWLGARIPVLAAQPESLALLLDAGTFLFSASMVAGIAIRTQPQSRDRTPHAVAGVARHEGRHQLPP